MIFVRCQLSVVSCKSSALGDSPSVSTTDYGPLTTDKLQIHRLRPLLMLAELAAAEDQLLAVFPRTAGDATLAVHAGAGDRMPAAVGTTFTTTQRMVDRVHRLGTGVRANAHVPAPAGLSDAHVN